MQAWAQKYQLNKLGTEQAHPLTAQLSQIFSQHPLSAFALLHAVDQGVVADAQQFADVYSLVDRPSGESV